jgi:hypothetical protein
LGGAERSRKALEIWAAVRFSQEQPAGRQIAVTYDATSRCRDDFDGRPSAPDGLRVHRTRHFDIDEDHGDVAPGPKQEDRLVGVRGLTSSVIQTKRLDEMAACRPRVMHLSSDMQSLDRCASWRDSLGFLKSAAQAGASSLAQRRS